jgi:hypothetical protein
MRLITAIALLGGAWSMMASATAGVVLTHVVLTNTDREIIVDISALKTNTDATIRFVNNEEYIVDIYGIDSAENLKSPIGDP